MKATMACQFKWKAIIWRLMSSTESHFLEQVCENIRKHTIYSNLPTTECDKDDNQGIIFVFLGLEKHSTLNVRDVACDTSYIG